MLSAQVIRPPVRKSHIDPLHLQSHRVEQKSNGKFLECDLDNCVEIETLNSKVKYLRFVYGWVRVTITHSDAT